MPPDLKAHVPVLSCPSSTSPCLGSTLPQALTLGYDWTRLDPRRAADFVWDEQTPGYGVTPILVALAVYWPTVLAIQRGMSNRQPLQLRAATIWHNMFLCIWSLAMFVFLAWSLWKHIGGFGLDAAFCTTGPNQERGPMYYSLCKFRLCSFSRG